MPIAAVVAVNESETGRTLTVRCTFCRSRHKHRWPIDQQTPGIRLSHCKRRRRPYLIGEVPSLPLLQLCDALRKSVIFLRRVAWMNRFTPADRAAVALAAKSLIDAVATGKAHLAERHGR